MTLSIATIPVTVTPEAAARIAELGFHAQVEQMIEHARHLPDVVRIEVTLNERYELGDEDGVVVEAWAKAKPCFDPNDTTDWDLGYWAVDTFPPEVLAHLHLSYMPYLEGEENAG